MTTGYDFLLFPNSEPVARIFLLAHQISEPDQGFLDHLAWTFLVMPCHDRGQIVPFNVTFGSRFSNLKVQSDQRVDDKVKGYLLLLTSSILLLPSYFFHLPSYIRHHPSDISWQGTVSCHKVQDSRFRIQDSRFKIQRGKVIHPVWYTWQYH